MCAFFVWLGGSRSNLWDTQNLHQPPGESGISSSLRSQLKADRSLARNPGSLEDVSRIFGLNLRVVQPAPQREEFVVGHIKGPPFFPKGHLLPSFDPSFFSLILHYSIAQKLHFLHTYLSQIHPGI